MVARAGGVAEIVVGAGQTLLRPRLLGSVAVVLGQPQRGGVVSQRAVRIACRPVGFGEAVDRGGTVVVVAELGVQFCGSVVVVERRAGPAVAAVQQTDEAFSGCPCLTCPAEYRYLRL